MLRSLKGTLAVSAPVFNKIESEAKGGLVLNASRINLMALDLYMDYDHNGLLLKAGQVKILIRQDSALQGWAKAVLKYGSLEFVMCPEGVVQGFELKDI
jgi:hypothetical protein